MYMNTYNQFFVYKFFINDIINIIVSREWIMSDVI